MQKIKSPTPIEDLKKKAVRVLHRYIKERDSDEDYFTCINCGKVKHIGQMQAGHYLAAGSSSALKYNPLNINGECISCNYYKVNNEAYRRNLIQKIGLEEVEDLHSMAHEIVNWDRDELLKIYNTYK